MSRSVLNALKAVAVLVLIAAVCVGVLSVCNMFFPKYVPVLDSATASSINAICPTGQSDGDAFNNGYIVMLQESEYGADLDAFNKDNKSGKAEILAVYGEPKGDNMYSYTIEVKSTGRDGDVVLLVAYVDGTVVGATVKKQGESYFYKLPENLFDTIKGTSGAVDMNKEIGKTGATLSLTAIDRAVNLSNKFAMDYKDKIKSAITERARTALSNGGEA